MITAVVLAKNEEKNIALCLKSLQWCDQILLIDDFSNDKTAFIAKKYNALVYKRKLEGSFGKQRNFALKKINKGWILFVDADEIVSSQLAKEIKLAISKNNKHINGFYFKRQDKFMGKTLKHGETAAIKLLRLAKKDSGQWQGKVHETWQVKGKTEVLNFPLIHQRNLTIDQFLTKINNYSTLRAKELYQLKKKTNIFLILLYPLVKFSQNYFLRLGFLDGMPGLSMALMMSIHSFLVRAKLYFLNKNENKTF